jgi:antitoxin PrlF
MTTTVTVGSRGQITVPKKLRLQLGLAPGVRLTLTRLDDGRIAMRVKNRPISAVAGVLTTDDQPTVTIEQMRR